MACPILLVKKPGTVWREGNSNADRRKRWALFFYTAIFASFFFTKTALLGRRRGLTSSTCLQTELSPIRCPLRCFISSKTTAGRYGTKRTLFRNNSWAKHPRSRACFRLVYQTFRLFFVLDSVQPSHSNAGSSWARRRCMTRRVASIWKQ